MPLKNTKVLFTQLPNIDPSHVQALCDQHYQKLYRLVHATSPCAGCGARPKARQLYTRHSPDAITVTEYLTEHTEFGATVMPDDVLCKACYDMHLTILNSISHSESERSLEYMMTIWSMKAKDEDEK